MIWELTELYNQMLADRTHVWRFGPGSDGSLSTRRVVCGNRSVTGGCVRPPKHGGGHSMYPILDDPGATPIPELLARLDAQGENTAP